MKGIDQMLSSTIEDLKFQFIFEELCYLHKKVEILEKNCTQEGRWCHMAIFQLQNKEAFRELLLDLKSCYNTTRDIYLSHYPNQSNKILPIEFFAPTYDQVLEDGQELKKELELILQEEISKDYEIAQHLLLRLRNLDRVDGGDLNALEVPYDFKPPILIKKIGKGGFGDVYKSNWFGLTCATKIIKGDPEYLLNSRKEAGILAGLSHPNLVQFFGFGIINNVGGNLEEQEIGATHLKKTNLLQILKNLLKFLDFRSIQKIDENPNEDETSEMHLVMELMDSNLSSFLKEIKRPLSYYIAIDIMHQIAKGVDYLHDMQVAHLDLKPDNILCSLIPIKDLDPCHIFKVMDYGTSQLEVSSNPEQPEPSMYTIGTLGYMAPEMVEESKIPRYPFQADVWSFAMICSEILSGNIPYYNLEPKDLYDQMKSTHGLSLRPDIPNDCEGLTFLIQECWSQDPLQRPTFSEICDRLIGLKKSFWRRGSCALRDSKSIVNHVTKVKEQIVPPREFPINLDHQLSKAKGLLKMNYLGIVGMGGIGKTTLAKAIFDDTRVKSTYYASCFVAECKNYQNSYEILCKILSKLGNDQKPRNLGDAQEMMKKLLIGKNILLILDDVSEEALLHDIVPSNLVQASKGTTIIITTRQWSTIKSFVDIGGRLDIELLDEKAATTLFTTHLCWDVTSLSQEFVVMRKYIVEACNGLPLSLKVMGAFLHHKKKLRSWEQALQKMARGRNLDGDEQIWNTLQISFDGLNDGIEKRMFLDMSCFFCRDVYPSGISKETMLSLWSKDAILLVGELERLIDMSLLKVNGDDDILEMHDQLRDMGRMISKNTRIWKMSMIPESGFSSKDIEVLEGISLQGIAKHHVPFQKQNPNLDFEELRVLILSSTLDNLEAYIDNLNFLLKIASQSSQLEAIIIQKSQKKIGLSHALLENMATTLSIKISKLCDTHVSLKVLDLIGLDFLKQLPKKIASSNTLLQLDLSFCSNLVALTNKVGNLSSLTTFNLSGCSSLTSLPEEVKNLSSLTTFDLSGCSSLVVLPKEVGNLSFLTTLNLKNCSNLVALPNEVGNLTSLNNFYLSECSSLAVLPKEVRNLSSLTTFDLSGCSNLAVLPKEVWEIPSLTNLYLKYYSKLVALPKEVENLSSLTTFDLSGCSSLEILPKEVGNLSFLTTFYLKDCSKLVALPKEMGNLSFLTTFDLNGCSNLVVLPKEMGNLSSLITFDLSGCSSLAILPKEVGNLSSLTTLHLKDCSKLMAIPKEVENLSSLTTFDLSGCSILAVLPNEVGKLSSLITLYLKDCSSLMALPKEVGDLSLLILFDLSGCSCLVSLPKEIGDLSSLTTLYLKDCSNLIAMPKEVGDLSSLSLFDLSGCSNLVVLPKEVGNLSLLTTLYLKDCSNLVALPKEVGNLSLLTLFYLSGCSCLVSLPKEIGDLSSLTTLYLKDCSNLVALPKEVGNLSLLILFDLSGCSSLVVLPKEVGNLSSLTTLYLKDCSNLVALPKEVGNLSSLALFDLSGCSSLVVLPKEVENLSSLTTLYLKDCSNLVALPKEVGNLSSLALFDLSGCSSLVVLPKEVGNLSSLTTFYLKDCSNLVALPNEVGNLSLLTLFDLSGCSRLVVLPNEMENLSSLTTLYLKDCSKLEALPKEIGNLSSLTTFDLSGCSNLTILPMEVDTCLP